MATSLEGKVVIIRGASSGIGAAAARELARKDAQALWPHRRALCERRGVHPWRAYRGGSRGPGAASASKRAVQGLVHTLRRQVAILPGMARP
jgi:NAD(P)-dependent dehydrogenase (short-subunit alcohol dehydrogenase family)